MAPGEEKELREKNPDLEYWNGCGFEQPKYRRTGLKIMVEFQKVTDAETDKKRPLQAESALHILKNISEDHCIRLGFDPVKARPHWMIITVLPVAPPPVRPSIVMDSTRRQEDDLTFEYMNILKCNEHLTQNDERGAASHVINDQLMLLQFHVATLINNEMPGQPVSRHRSGRQLKALRARLKGKEGRLRGNLVGKRVDFSARTVITPDPILSLDQLGVPRTIALNLTFPEIVTSLNIDKMRRLVQNGPTIWPGAKTIIRDDGTSIDLRYLKKRTDAHLEPGYKVERHLADDDFVLFNRQPSLHKMSIMGHRVKVLPYSTFRLNLSVTSPYNADFDGDEMNMHVPQSLETKAEITQLMHVPRQIVSPQSNKPVMGIVQDTLIGIKLFTLRDNFLEEDQVMNLLMWVNDFNGKIPKPAIYKPKCLWTGKQILSLILPEVNLERQGETFKAKTASPIDVSDSTVLIEGGELIMGHLCKRTVGSASGGLIHIIWNDFGAESAKQFLSDAQRLINNWLVGHGFTVGVCDTIAGTQTLKKIRETLVDAKRDVINLVRKAQMQQLECQPGKNMLDSFEAQVNTILNKARDVAGETAEINLQRNNNIKQMVVTGSKGTRTNISQIMACVGQQNVEGKRIPFGFKQRTLPHFGKDDYGPESKGFVENSYLTGLTPQEFYFHAMGGREGLIDTAVKTSETGYIYRRLVKALEDVMVKYDGTVRNSLGQIVQFLYGEDGMAGEFIEDQELEILTKGNHQMIKDYRFFDPNKSPYEKLPQLKRVFDNDEDARHIVENVEIQLSLERHFNQLMTDRNELRTEIFDSGNKNQHIPVNITRLIWNAKKKFKIDKNVPTNLLPMKILEDLEGLIAEVEVVKGNCEISKEAQFNGTKLFAMKLRSTLSPKKLIFKDRLTIDAFGWLIGEIKSRFYQSIVHPGEMVGSIAAQSLGEPATQMTLNTFHFAGVSAKNVTLGVPRLKEVINVAKKIKTPTLTIFMNNQEEWFVKKVQSKLEYTTLNHVACKSQIFYDPNPGDTIIPEDKDLVQLNAEIETDEEQDIKMYAFVLRITLDFNKMTDKKVKMEDLQEIIIEKFGKNTVEVIVSDENATELIVRIRLKHQKENEDTGTEKDHLQLYRAFEEQVLKMTLKGIPDIKKVYMRKAKMLIYNKETGIPEKKEEEWILETDGTNLHAVLGVEGIDNRRTYSNNTVEILEVLGIEAVRLSLLKELRIVLDSYSIYVNYRHLSTLCDVMCQRGHLTAITRHGINRMETGPLRKSSFEETVEVLMEAAVFSEVDNLKGVTENVIMGQLAPLGTGYFDLLIDFQRLSEAKDIIDVGVEDYAGIDDRYQLSTPIQNSPSGPGRTPYGDTPNYNAYGKTPMGETTPAYDEGMGFTPLHAMGTNNPYSPAFSPGGYSSPAYMLSATSPFAQTNIPSSPIDSPRYSPRSPNSGLPGAVISSPPYSQPGYSPQSGLSPSSSTLYYVYILYILFRLLSLAWPVR